MIIAQQKRKENIAEYILYMWQVEDLIRACGMNLDLIEQKIIPQFKQSDEINNQIKDWYANLIILMNNEGIREKGHLQVLQGLVNDMNQHHLHLIHNEKDKKYISLCHSALQVINAFKIKTGEENLNDTEAALLLMYGVLMSKIKRSGDNNKTKETIEPVRKLVAYLANYYKKTEEGKD